MRGEWRAALKRLIERELTAEIKEGEIEDIVEEVMEEKYLPLIRDSIKSSLKKAAFREGDGEEIVQEGGVSEEIDEEGKGRALYLYGIVEGEAKELKIRGIEDNELRVVHFKDLSAIVHSCSPEPYQSQDREVVRRWVERHQQVLDRAREEYPALAPVSFNTIFEEDGSAGGEEKIKGWLEDQYDSLKDQLEELRGREEYGVQIIYRPEPLTERIREESDQVRQLGEKIKGKTSGQAYMYRQKLQKIVQEEREELLQDYRRKFLEEIEGVIEKREEEEVKKIEGEEEMLVNLSCLVEEGEVEKLGDRLEEIDKKEGFRVRFTGPWAPYSFTSLGDKED